MEEQSDKAWIAGAGPSTRDAPDHIAGTSRRRPWLAAHLQRHHLIQCDRTGQPTRLADLQREEEARPWAGPL